jgi:hypothetical protein
LAIAFRSCVDARSTFFSNVKLILPSGSTCFFLPPAFASAFSTAALVTSDRLLDQLTNFLVPIRLRLAPFHGLTLQIGKGTNQLAFP